VEAEAESGVRVEPRLPTFLDDADLSQPGVGKGNWIRPSKEERERRAAEKKAELERLRAAESAAAEGEEEDAEGEDE
jgi:hypothetical protein